MIRIFVVLVALLLTAAPAVAREPAPPAPAQPTLQLTKEQLDAIIRTLSSVPGLPAELVKRQTDIAADLRRLNSTMVDLAVPDSPAFTVLNLSPEEIARPTTGRKLAASLLNGVDRHGVLQSGVAIDTLPYLALAGHLLTLDNYRDTPGTKDHYAVRFVARTQVSLATAKAAGADSNAMKAALGLRFTILDQGDPRTDTMLDDCVDAALELPDPPAAVVPPMPDSLDEGTLQQWQEDVAEAKQAVADYEARVAAWEPRSAEAIRSCRDAARKRAWNATRWIAAYAPAGISASGALADLTSSGAGVWTTFGYGFKGLPGLQEHAQLLLHARYRDNESVADPADRTKQIRQDSQRFGVQLRAGTPDSSIAFEAIVEHLMPVAGADKSDRRYSIGYERRLAPNLWLGVALGSGGGTPGRNRTGAQLLSSFKWGFAEGPSLGIPQ